MDLHRVDFLTLSNVKKPFSKVETRSFITVTSQIRHIFFTLSPRLRPSDNAEILGIFMDWMLMINEPD